jgi:hypothetical protein
MGSGLNAAGVSQVARNVANQLPDGAAGFAEQVRFAVMVGYQQYAQDMARERARLQTDTLTFLGSRQRRRGGQCAGKHRINF